MCIRDRQSQGGNIILNEGGDQIGGIMGQESKMLQEYQAGGIAVATVDPCIDCEDPGLNLGGGLAVSGMAAGVGQDQHQGQGQVGVFGELKLEKSSTRTDTFTMSGESNEDKTETWDKEVTETKDKTETWDKTVVESYDEEGSFHADGSLDASVNAEGSGEYAANHTDTHSEDYTPNEDGCENCDEVITDSSDSSGSASGNLSADKSVSGEVNADYTYGEDWNKDVSEVSTESKIETKDVSEIETLDKHKDWTMTTTCTTTKEKSVLISGNGVAGMQYGGGSQSGHVGGFAFSAAAGGGIEYNPLPAPDQVVLLP